MESNMKSVIGWIGGVLAFVSANAAVTVDLSSEIGAVKLMNAVGDGPVLGRPDGDAAENTGNSELFRALEIPFCRTHDSNSCIGRTRRRAIPSFTLRKSSLSSRHWTSSASSLRPA